MIIRNIKEEDNESVALIIRKTLEEFNANQPGTVYYDENIWHLSDFFIGDKMSYFVMEEDGKIVGGAGVFPTDGLPQDTVELVKLYLLPQARGKGWGRKLIEKCINYAFETGYKILYIESMDELKDAVVLYEKLGFKHIDKPMGNTGHSYCKIWMMRQIVTKQ